MSYESFSALFDACGTPQRSFVEWMTPPLDANGHVGPSQLQYLLSMKKQWDWHAADGVEVPRWWICEEENLNLCGALVQGLLPQTNIKLFLAPLRKVLIPMSRIRIKERIIAVDATAPDFCMGVLRPHFKPSAVVWSGDWAKPIRLKMDPWYRSLHCSEMSANLIMYSGGRHFAEHAIYGMFTGTPAGWLKRKPRVYLPPELVSGEPFPGTPDFAVLLQTCSASFNEHAARDARLGISVLHPALVIGLKGPNAWADDPVKYRSMNQTLDDVLCDLRAFVRPNLEILIATWHLRCRSHCSVEPLPQDAIVFGIIYDSQDLHIVAHYPVIADGVLSLEYAPRYRFVQCVVDTLPFPEVPPEDFTQYATDRLRVVIALLTVQRHVALRVTSIWDVAHGYLPPLLLVAAEEQEIDILGPTRFPRMTNSLPDDNLDGREAFEIYEDQEQESGEDESDEDEDKDSELEYYSEDEPDDLEAARLAVCPLIEPWLEEVEGADDTATV